jgi:RNA polymerase sigma-70 factor (ECF subfamily)
MSSPASGADTRAGNDRFEQTQWTVILKARDEGAPGAAEAMETFARSYWPPIYRYIRREGYGRDDAQDLTQSFYQHLLRKQLLNGVGERTGRFRNYLLTCLKHFLADERDHAQARKRGGGKIIISRDAMDEEERNALEPSDKLTPAQLFERRWAQAVLTDAMNRLRADYQRRGQGALFEELKDLQPGSHGERSHAVIARSLGMTEQAIKNAVLTFRRRYADCLRRQVARTVETSGQIEEELNYLIQIFGS